MTNSSGSRRLPTSRQERRQNRRHRLRRRFASSRQPTRNSRPTNETFNRINTMKTITETNHTRSRLVALLTTTFIFVFALTGTAATISVGMRAGMENETIIQVYTVLLYDTSDNMIMIVVMLTLISIAFSFRFQVEKTFRWHCRTRGTCTLLEVPNLDNWAMGIPESTLSRPESRDLPIATYSQNETYIVMFQEKCTWQE